MPAFSSFLRHDIPGGDHVVAAVGAAVVAGVEDIRPWGGGVALAAVAVEDQHLGSGLGAEAGGEGLPHLGGGEGVRPGGVDVGEARDGVALLGGGDQGPGGDAVVRGGLDGDRGLPDGLGIRDRAGGVRLLRRVPAGTELRHRLPGGEQQGDSPRVSTAGTLRPSPPERSPSSQRSRATGSSRPRAWAALLGLPDPAVTLAAHNVAPARARAPRRAVQATRSMVPPSLRDKSTRGGSGVCRGNRGGERRKYGRTRRGLRVLPYRSAVGSRGGKQKRSPAIGDGRGRAGGPGSASGPPARPRRGQADRKVVQVSLRSTGKRTWMRVPLPSLLWSWILPWWSCTACLTMERPRPVPPEALEWLLSTR